jgi:hypothetical protein
MNAPKALLAATALLGAAAWSPNAGATAGFPAEIDTHLALPAGAIENLAPPDGCHLCHVNGSTGGDPLTRFGTLMKSNGAVKYVNSSVDGALDALKSSSPRLIDDLKNRINPNDDPDAGAGGLGANVDPVPQYGCGSISAGTPNAWSGGLVAAALAASLVRRRCGRPTSMARIKSFRE